MTVIVSLEDEDGVRCVDVFRRDDGSFGFKEFRRDPEDQGRWTLVADYSHQRFSSQSATLRAAGKAIPWLADVHPASVS
jgi:hypothetical protein